MNEIMCIEQSQRCLLMLRQVHVLILMLKILIKILNLKFEIMSQISKYRNIFTKGYI